MSKLDLDENVHEKKKSKRVSKPAFMIFAGAIFLLLSVSSYGYFKYLSESPEIPQNKALEMAEKNNYINLTDSSATVENIKITVKGTLSDTIRTVFYAEVTGISSNKGLGVESLTDSKGKTYSLDGVTNGTTTTKGVFSKVIEFLGGPSDNTNLKLKVSSIGDIKGEWVIDVPIKVMKPKEFIVNKEINKNGTTIKIERLISSKSTTQLVFQLTGKRLNIKDGSLSSSGFSANLRRCSLVLEKNKENVYTGDAFFEPIDSYKTSVLKWNIISDTDAQNMEIELPLEKQGIE